MSSFTFSLQEFVKGCGSITKRWVDELLDKMTASDHLKAVTQIQQVCGPCNYSITLFLKGYLWLHWFNVPLPI